jgi:hypothetical protein
VKRIVAIVVLSVALACAAVALGAVPKKGLYTGTTHQGRALSIKINKNHNIPDGGFRIDWSANKCDKGKSWDDKTESDGTIDVADDGSFRQVGHYNHKIGKYTGHIRITGKGKFNTRTSATGAFSVKVRVTKNGTTIDRCHGSTSWSVSD